MGWVGGGWENDHLMSRRRRVCVCVVVLLSSFFRVCLLSGLKREISFGLLFRSLELGKSAGSTFRSMEPGKSAGSTWIGFLT